MANEERKAQLSFGVDASGVKPGMAEIKRDVREMAQDVQQSGQQAAKAIQAIGDGAPAAAKKMDGATKSIVGSIERATAAMQAGEKGSASYFEALAKQRGANVDVLKPYIDQLRQAEEAQRVASGSLNKMGVSAAQTAAALRGVPAQFTDIIVSLQGGQAPLTVFLQQGGQLKDMFGGAGNAARALGGYVLSLVSPLNVAAAAAGVLAVAYNQGSKEAQAYSTALILTGNAAGTTSGQLKAYAQDISGVVGTQGKAAESLTALAGTGKVVGDVLRDAGLAAVQYERATGQAVSKTADQFADLRNEPLSGILKLNDGMNFLTESTYRQIKSLEEQGRTTDAARVAQQAYADALIGRAGEIDRNLGSLERGWRAVADAAKKGWDSMLGVGRAQTTQDRLKQFKDEIAAVEKQLDSGKGFASTEGGAAFGSGRATLNPAAQQQLKDRLASLGAEAASLEGVAYAEKMAADAGRERANQMQATQAWDKAGEKYLSDKVKLERELTQARNEGIAAGKSNAEIEERLANIREEYAKKGAAAAKAELSAYQSLVAAVRAKIDQNQLEITTGGKLNEAERLRVKLMAETAEGSRKMTAAHRAEALALLEKLDASERVLEVARNQRKFEDQRDKENVRIADDIAKINARAQALEDEASVYGKSSSELRALTIDRLNEQKAILQGFPGSQQRIDQINDEIAAIRRLGAAEDQIAGLKMQSHADDLLRSAQEQARIYEDEAKLAGLTRLEREKIIALRQVELKYAKELAKIDKMPDADGDQRAAKLKARDTLEQAKRIEGEAAVSKVIQQDWDRTADEINKSLTDALLRGFESGKSFAENFRDTLKNMFNTLVLRPVISAIIAPVSGAVSGLLGGSGGGAGSSFLNTASMASSAYSLFSGNSLLSAIPGLGVIGGALSGFGAAVTASIQSLIGLTGTSAQMIASLTAAGHVAAPGMAAGVGFANLIPGWGWALAGIGALFGGDIFRGLFGRKLKDSGIEGDFGGEQGFAGRTYQFYKGGAFRSNKTKYGELDEEVRKGLADQYTAMRDSIKEMGKVLGLGGEALDKFTAHIKVSLHGLSPEDAQKKLQEEFAKLGISMADMILGLPSSIQDAANDRKYLFGVNPDAAAAAPVDPAAQANLDAFKKLQKAGESSLDTLTRLATSLAATNGVFETLGHSMYEASLQGGDMADKLVEIFGGVDKFTAASADYFAKFYSAEEQREAARKQIEKQLATVDIKLPDINADDARAQYRKLVEAQDLNTEAGRKAYAVLIQLAGAFDQVAISADVRRGLEERLLVAQGKDRAVVELRRKQEHEALAKVDPALAKLVEQIYDLEDAALAAAQAQAIAEKGRDLEQRLLIAQGEDRQALDLRRLQEYYALLKLDPALAAMVIEIYKAEDAASAITDAYRRLQNAATLESERLNAQLEAIDAQRTALGQQRTLADESLALITGIFDLVRSNARELYGQVESTASMQAAQGWAFVEQALETARRTGYLPEQAPLQEAIGAARGGLESRAYATQFEADRDRLVLAGMLSGIEAIAGPQKTAVEQQIEAIEAQTKTLDLQTEAINKQLKAQQEMLEYWRRQIDIANGTFDATATIADAVAAIRASLSKPASGTGTGAEVGSTRPTRYEESTSAAVWGGSSSSAPQQAAQVLPRDDYGRVLYQDGSKGPPVDSWFEGTILKWARLSPFNPANEGKNLPPLPAFAVGTNFVPYDTPAIVHKGERIIPAADNRALMAAIDAGQQSGRSERLEGLVAQLVAENRQQAGEILRLNARIAKVLERWDGDGTPPQREEQTA